MLYSHSRILLQLSIRIYEIKVHETRVNLVITLLNRRGTKQEYMVYDSI